MSKLTLRCLTEKEMIDVFVKMEMLFPDLYTPSYFVIHKDGMFELNKKKLTDTLRAISRALKYRIYGERRSDSEIEQMKLEDLIEKIYGKTALNFIKELY